MPECVHCVHCVLYVHCASYVHLVHRALVACSFAFYAHGLLILTIKVDSFMSITLCAHRVLGVYARVCFVLSHLGL
jgi:hypothetical protein